MDIRFIDLFAGIGGIRLGLEQAAEAAGFKPICVFTSEIKVHIEHNSTNNQLEQ